MRNFFALSVIAFLFTSSLFAGNAHAADKSKGKDISITGKITTTKTDVDKFTEIKLTTSDGTVYNITIDEKGNGVAKQYEGISVQVNGTETEKDGAKWLTVKSVGEKKGKKGK